VAQWGAETAKAADGFCGNNREAMPFESILDLGSEGPTLEPTADARGVEPGAEPSCLHDLNLDQMVQEITSSRERYNLAPFFHAPVASVDAVRYRHEALRDLEDEHLLAAVREFAEHMSARRDQLAQAEDLYYSHQRERVFVAVAGTYCDAVSALHSRLAGISVSSRAFCGLRDYLAAYVEDDAFKSLVAETGQVVDALAAVRYTVHTKGGRVTVGRYEGEEDYSAQIADVFAKFKRRDKQVTMAVPNPQRMNHVEAQIMDRVEYLHPEPFGALHSYCKRHADHLDPVIGRFEREVQFYLGYLDYIERLKTLDLAFCYPRVSARSKEIEVEDGFDIVLASKRAAERSAVVVNGLRLSGAERIFVVTGPNNGGKTTFARMVGQLHYLASLGLPVPAASARLMLPDRVFTHFEREEDIATLRGKLDDELVRIREILEQATGSSLIVMNESFSSTTLEDALFLGTEVIGRIVERGCLAVYVTFIDELASLNDATVSVVATVAPEDPSVRTFHVVRQPANGLAYAAAIAQKYGLTYESVRRRIAA
jgi:DNA mismatch repair protein MutS